MSTPKSEEFVTVGVDMNDEDKALMIRAFVTKNLSPASLSVYSDTKQAVDEITGDEMSAMRHALFNAVLNEFILESLKEKIHEEETKQATDPESESKDSAK